MRSFILLIAALQGLAVVGLLFLLEAVIRAFAPEWQLPFSEWWSLLFCIPGIAFACMMERC